MNIMQTSSSYSQDNTQNRLSVNVMQPPASLALATAQFHFHPPVYHQQLHQHNQSFPIVGAHSSNSALLPLSPSIFSSSMSSSLSSSAAVSAAVDSVSYPTAYSFLLNSSQQTMPMIGEADGELPLPSFLEMFGPMLAAAEASSSKSSRAHITAKHNSSHQYSRPLSMAPPQQHQQQHDSVLAEAANSKKRKKSEDGLSASGPSLSHLSLLLEAHDSTSASNNTDSLSLSDRDRDRAMLTVSNSSTAGAGRLGGSQQLQGPTVGAGSGFGAVSVSHDMEDDEPDPSYDYAMSGGLGLGSDESTGWVGYFSPHTIYPDLINPFLGVGLRRSTSCFWKALCFTAKTGKRCYRS